MKMRQSRWMNTLERLTIYQNRTKALKRMRNDSDSVVNTKRDKNRNINKIGLHRSIGRNKNRKTVVHSHYSKIDNQTLYKLNKPRVNDYVIEQKCHYKKVLQDIPKYINGAQDENSSKKAKTQKAVCFRITYESK